jgi:hypothetical protein
VQECSKFPTKVRTNIVITGITSGSDGLEAPGTGDLSYNSLLLREDIRPILILPAHEHTINRHSLPPSSNENNCDIVCYVSGSMPAVTCLSST